MDGKELVFSLGVVVVICLGIGYAIGAGVTEHNHNGIVGELENRLVLTQERVDEIAKANRELADRQQRALTILDRANRNLADAGATSVRIDNLIDRIIATVSAIEQANSILGGEK